MHIFHIIILTLNIIVAISGIFTILAGFQDIKAKKQAGIYTPQSGNFMLALFVITLLMIANIIYLLL